jgi:hypothetical protein
LEILELGNLETDDTILNYRGQNKFKMKGIKIMAETNEMNEMNYEEKMEMASRILASGIQLNEFINEFDSMEATAKTTLTSGLLGDASKKDMSLLSMYGQCLALIQLLRDSVECVKKLNDAVAEAIKDNEEDENDF